MAPITMPNAARLLRRDPRPMAQESAMRVWQRIGSTILRALYRVAVSGAEHVPVDGPVVLVSNHMGFLDGPVVFITAPRATHFLVKRPWFHGLPGAILHGCGQIPVTQNYGDREAIASARAVLASGGVVGVFPEGSRGVGDVAVAQQGASYLALSAEVPVVPVALVGTAGRTRSAWPRLRSRILVAFGNPFTVHDLPETQGMGRRETLGVANEHLRSVLAAHVTAAQRD